jgi:hypothetical protein
MEIYDPVNEKDTAFENREPDKTIPEKEPPKEEPANAWYLTLEQRIRDLKNL